MLHKYVYSIFFYNLYLKIIVIFSKLIPIVVRCVQWSESSLSNIAEEISNESDCFGIVLISSVFAHADIYLRKYTITGPNAVLDISHFENNSSFNFLIKFVLFISKQIRNSLKNNKCKKYKFVFLFDMSPYKDCW